MDKSDKALKKKNYFDNKAVERLLIEYHKRGCTDINLRDTIMEHATELIINVIRTHNLHNIYGGKDDSSFNDLFQIAWSQIESTLYKFNSGPGHPKVFNLWSQVARTVILATIKKNNRDRKNSDNYRHHLDNKFIGKSIQFERFIKEVREIFKYCEEFQLIINALDNLYHSDDRPHEGLINKLSESSGVSRMRITKFLKVIKLLSGELSDGPADDGEIVIKPSMMVWNIDED